MSHSHSHLSFIDSDDEMFQTPLDPPSPTLADTSSPPHTDHDMTDIDMEIQRLDRLIQDSDTQGFLPDMVIDQADDLIAVDTIHRSTIPVLSSRPAEPSFRPYRLYPGGAVMMYTPDRRTSRSSQTSRLPHILHDPSPPPVMIPTPPSHIETPTSPPSQIELFMSTFQGRFDTLMTRITSAEYRFSQLDQQLRR